MIKLPVIRAGLCIALGTAMFACGKGADTAPETSIQKALRTSTNLDSAAIGSATVAMRQFLDASREGSPTRENLQALTSCGDSGGESYFPTTLLAGYALLPFDMHGDTVVARAAAVTVAEQDVDRRASGFTARIRVREDILEWDVIPTDQPDQWVVCNGIRFGYFGADSLTVWRPDGANYDKALSLVDSIVKARGN
ncbi:MAG: hypothetical protein H7Z40_06515 [Phycisphaerae bacterium]|nr:hypothetical protein [Gemmatimonadaceae bacterium]